MPNSAAGQITLLPIDIPKEESRSGSLHLNNSLTNSAENQRQNTALIALTMTGITSPEMCGGPHGKNRRPTAAKEEGKLISIIELVLSLLGTALAAAKVNGVAAEIVAGIAAAIAELEKVRGTPVTYQQLEGLRITPKW